MDGQVGSWVRAALEEASYDNDEDEEVVQEITNTLKVESVKGGALLLLTSDDMKDMKIPVGPRKVLENRIAAVSQPTAKAGLQRSRMVVVRFRAVQPFLLFGVMLSSQQGFRSSLSFTVLACTSGSGRGSWLLQVSRKSGCPSRFADASERGVSPRLEVGGSPVRLCARSPGCGCFCLRLDFTVTVSVRGSQGNQPRGLSACL